MEFKAVDTAMVGIRPLSYDPKYVDKGAPDPGLTGDLQFLAERMGLFFAIAANCIKGGD